MDAPQASPGVDSGQASSSVPVESTPSSTPAPTPTTPPADGQTPLETGQTSAELYDLPDGRKVDAATLSREWKENFLPDYTRKSQALAQGQPPQQSQIINNPQAQAPVWSDPNWVPQTYAEIVEAAAQKMQYDQHLQQQQQEQYKQQVNQFVDSQISEIKKLEPNLSEELLFQHANKYGFSDLMTAFQNMRDYNVAVKRAEQQTVQNMQNRAADPIASKSGQSAPGTGIDYRSLQNPNQSPIDVLRRLQGK